MRSERFQGRGSFSNQSNKIQEQHRHTHERFLPTNNNNIYNTLGPHRPHRLLFFVHFCHQKLEIMIRSVGGAWKAVLCLVALASTLDRVAGYCEC